MLRVKSLDYLANSRILITGGTGSLGICLSHMILRSCPSATVVIFSRDEYKQFLMQRMFLPEQQERLRFFLGDVRDQLRLRRAFTNVQYVIHAAALKQVPTAEYNPSEFVRTNINGAENVINAAIDAGVKRVVALSTDKAANPINLYGATKLCSDKLFVSGNSYSGAAVTRFSVVRYGNVVGSRGSVVPFFLRRRKEGILTITDPRMTRFWITLEQGASLVVNAMREMRGGEVWIPKIPSMKLTDLARVIAPECRQEIIGIRPGEKLHEVMVPVDEARQTVEFDDHFVITPAFPWWDKDWRLDRGGKCCQDGFYYGSDNNTVWLDDENLTKMIVALDLPEAKVWASEREKSPCSGKPLKDLEKN